MILGILAVGLQEVVVNVLHGDFRPCLSRPIASSSSMTMVPVASWVRV